MGLPGIQHGAALLLHAAVGLFAPGGGFFGFVQALVASLLLANACLLGLIDVIAAALHQRDLLAPRRDDVSKVVAGGVEGERRQCRQPRGLERRKRVASVSIRNAGASG